jgi:hypothetical protein
MHQCLREGEMSHATTQILNNYSLMINKIQSALGTGECGDNLVEVARNAHKAEQELAALQAKLQKYNMTVAQAVEAEIGRKCY